MKKLIRATYPIEINIFILCVVFLLAFFFSHQLFEVHFKNPNDEKEAYFGMVLIAISAVLMILIVWEEILFHIKINEIEGGLLFSNHKTKLRIQVMLYSFIPLIFIYIYFRYDVKLLHFVIWAGICLIPPILEKISTGLNNYHDFLKLTIDSIVYKNNEKEGTYFLKNIKNISMDLDQKTIVKLNLLLNTDEKIIIDLDEMELDEYYKSIQQYINTNYSPLLTKN